MSPKWCRAEKILNEILEFVKKKNDDYGSSITLTGKIGLAARLVDKSYRFFNIIQKGSHNFEGEIDTIKDIIGYCILYFAYKFDKESDVNEQA